MKIIFFGTPKYVTPIIKKLLKEHKIVAVVTSPPKTTGREKRREFSEVDHFAYKRKLPIFHRAEEVLGIPADMGVVASYGEIIPSKVIKHFPSGILNIHPSLLPLHRGAAPVAASMISNQGVGVTIIKMDEEVDHGPIVSQFKDEIMDNETGSDLRDRLFSRSAQFLVDLIPSYLSNKINLKEQDHAKATFTKQLTREDGFVEPEIIDNLINNSEDKNSSKLTIRFMNGYEMDIDPKNMERFIWAMNSWPGVWTFVKLKNDEVKRLKILRSHTQKGEGQEKLILDLVQLEGKNPVSWDQFKEGYQDFLFAK